MAYATLAVVGLTTAERYFRAFAVDVHKDTTWSNKVASATASGVFNTTTGRWEQVSPVFFRSLTLGSTYYLRVRVQGHGKSTSSAWSSWWTEVPGDVAAPSVTNSPRSRQCRREPLLDYRRPTL